MADEAQILRDYRHLQFAADSRETGRLTSLLRMAPEPNVMVGWEFLDAVGERDRYTQIVGQDTPWSRLFEMDLPAYRELTLEFFSTFLCRYYLFNQLINLFILFVSGHAWTGHLRSR